jgi:hypothetical protein
LAEGEMRLAKCEVFHLSWTVMHFGNGFDHPKLYVQIRYVVP